MKIFALLVVVDDKVFKALFALENSSDTGKLKSMKQEKLILSYC